ncbi:phosphonoacetaldehyde hydrolase [Bacillus sp. MUM 116]|uniref:phosphonoacetaldehyde hydrolase n=1 Tax=Bacillus sp. MUM 116 TaxID=1678002 RepID=UPI0008F5721F|nr:phosphonoacetaldehyde hydrolase [Bacillus sp. MUM 116]
MSNQSPQIEAVIFDWAGTTVDYGCFAPLNVFLEIFRKRGIEVTDEEARAPMGLLKWDHIRAMCDMDRIAGVWKEKFGRVPTDKDVDDLYADFEPLLFASLRNYCTPIPGALDLVARLRQKGIKIGSTTGYTSEMMAVVAPEAKKQGYAPDYMFTPDDAPAGRPYPWMCYLNAMNLGVFPMKHIIKVGDTVSDVKEGVNAGVWSVGIIKGGSELGLKEEEVNSMDPDLLAEKMEVVAKRFKDAGAHYVIDSIGELDKLIPKINLRLENGDF